MPSLTGLDEFILSVHIFLDVLSRTRDTNGIRMRLEILPPLRGLYINDRCYPTACAVGYILSPLRGWVFAGTGELSVGQWARDPGVRTRDSLQRAIPI